MAFPLDATVTEGGATATGGTTMATKGSAKDVQKTELEDMSSMNVVIHHLPCEFLSLTWFGMCIVIGPVVLQQYVWALRKTGDY